MTNHNMKSQHSALEAVKQILAEAGAPLHYEEITRRVLEQGLWTTKGKTPAATIQASLAVEIKRKGSAAAYVRAGAGCFALNPNVGQETQNRKAENKPLLKKHKSLSFTDAAERVLQESKVPQLHYRDITRLALECGWVDTVGKTPEASLYAQILTEVKRHRLRDEKQRFMILGRGMVSLAKRQRDGIAYQVDVANKQTRAKLLKRLMSMEPYAFEDLIRQLLLALGFEEVDVTSRSNDGGIDVRGTLVVGDVISTRLAVQVKRWKHNVQAPVVQQVRGSLGTHEQGLIITTSDFSKGARDEAVRVNATPVALMDGEKLVKLLVENEIGVTSSTLRLVQIDETDETASAKEEIHHGSEK